MCLVVCLNAYSQKFLKIILIWVLHNSKIMMNFAPEDRTN